MSHSVKQVLVTSQATVTEGQGLEPVAFFDDEGNPVDIGGGSGPTDVTWGDVSGKPSTFPPTTGTTASTAKPGNWTPAWGDVSGKPSTFPPATHTHAVGEVTGLQAVLDDLETRLAALEAAAE